MTRQQYQSISIFLAVLGLAAAQYDGLSAQSSKDQNDSNSVFETIPEVLDYGDYISGEQNTSIFIGLGPSNDTKSNQTFLSDVLPLAEQQISEPIAQYQGDYEDGENLGAFLLDMQTSEDLNASSIDTFLSLISDTEVLQDICGLGSVTVFAPNENAFDEFLQQENISRKDLIRFNTNRQKLLKILSTHVVKAQIQELSALNFYLTLNDRQLIQIFLQDGGQSYGIKTEQNSALVEGTIFSVIECSEFNVAAVVIDQVLIPDNVSQ